jgi:hypothetical protein
MTTPVTVAQLLGDIKTFAYNPSRIQRAAMAALNSIYDGTIPIVDASNPFVYCLEYSSVNLTAFLQNSAALNRRLYPAAATTFEDLYLHMSNTDYANIFALPSTVQFYLVINKAQLENALVLDPDTGISKVTIPRNTVFYAAEVPFSIQYPIDIRKLAHGSLQIVYDVSVVSPLQNIDTNVIEYETLRGIDGEEYIQFALETQQFSIKTQTNPFNSINGFAFSVPFEDQYYAARVYVTSNNAWKEIAVTYTEQVYDPNTPTAALQVVGNTLNVRLPLVYITTGLIAGQVRVDIYQTQGPLDLQMANYHPNDFTATFDNIDKNETSAYITAFKSVTNVAPFAKDRATGGRSALTFDELQQRVIQNSIGPRNLPITPSQIQTTLLDLGYTLVKNIDTITNRIYLATKALPSPNSPTLVTAANANVATIVTQVLQADSLQGCFGHATGMTISPKSIVQTVNGICSLITKAAYTQLISLPLADLCAQINSGKYSYTPFYYVLDNTSDSFDVRPYYLDEPQISSRSFIQENPDTGLQASIGAGYLFEKTDTGYRLTISTDSNDAFKALADNEVFCQLKFQSPTQASPAYMLGVQQTRAHNTDERVFVFDLNCVYDVDSNDALALPSFATSGIAPTPRCGLDQVFSIVFATSNATALQSNTTNIDSELGAFQFPHPVIGVTQERITLIFGHSLQTLWNSFRSFTNLIPFKTYTADVPLLYDQDVYVTDPATGSIITIDNNGDAHYQVLHAAGTPVIDSQNNPVYAHRAGDPILDSFDRPIPVDNYQTIVNRSVDLVTLDGVYQFANDPVTLDYVKQIKASLLTSLTQELVSLNAEALEKTEIFYYPAITQGNVNALADNNQLVNIEAAQSLKVSLYVEEIVYNNKNLIASLQASTIKTIGNFLAANSTVAISQLEDALSSVYGSDVIAVTVTGLGGSGEYKVVTLTTDSTRLSIRKVLQLLPSSQIAVQEDISVVFTTHGLTN